MSGRISAFSERGFFMGRWAKNLLGMGDPEAEKEGIPWLINLMYVEIGTLVKLNLIFLLTVLPIFTIGPAWGALSSVSIQMLQGKTAVPVRMYLRAFRKSFKRFFTAGLVVTALAVIIGVSLQFYWHASAERPALLIPFLLVSVLAMAFVLITLYLFPVLIAADIPLKYAIWDAVLLCLAYPQHSIPSAAAAAAVFVLCAMFWPLSIPLALTLEFSASNLLISFAAWGEIKRHILEEGD